MGFDLHPDVLLKERVECQMRLWRTILLVWSSDFFYCNISGRISSWGNLVMLLDLALDLYIFLFYFCIYLLVLG